MKTHYFEEVGCPLCKSHETEFLFHAKDRRFANPEIFRLVKCNNCRLSYLNPRISKDYISIFYPPNEYYVTLVSEDEIYSRKAGIFTKSWIAYTKLFGVSKTMDGMPKGKVLDIGCGTGEYLKLLKEHGWDICGIDVNPDAITQAKKRRVKAFCGELHEAEFPSGFFDLIVMKHSLEHLYDPVRVLEEVYRILKKSGRIMIEVPNFASVESELFRTYWSGLDVPRHLLQFSPNTLKILLEKTGFNNIKIAHSPFPGYFISSLFDNIIGKSLQRSKFLLLWFGLTLLTSVFALIRKGSVILVYAQKT